MKTLDELQAEFRKAYGREFDPTLVNCVVAHDLFLSGWGMADGQKCYQVVLCNTRAEADAMQTIMHRDRKSLRLSRVHVHVGIPTLKGIVSYKVGKNCPLFN